MNTSAKIGLASLFALSLSSLPLTADATTAAPMNGQHQMPGNSMHKREGNCSRTMREGNCSRSSKSIHDGKKDGHQMMQKHKATGSV